MFLRVLLLCCLILLGYCIADNVDTSVDVDEETEATSSRSWIWQIIKSVNRMLLSNTLELVKITFIMVYAWPVLKFCYRWLLCRCVATYEITKANKNQIFPWIEAWCKHHPALRNNSNVSGVLMSKNRAEAVETAVKEKKISFGHVGSTSMVMYPSILKGIPFRHSGVDMSVLFTIKREIFRESHVPSDKRESVLPSSALEKFELDDDAEVRLFVETILNNRLAGRTSHRGGGSSSRSGGGGGYFWSRSRARKLRAQDSSHGVSVAVFDIFLKWILFVAPGIVSLVSSLLIDISVSKLSAVVASSAIIIATSAVCLSVVNSMPIFGSTAKNVNTFVAGTSGFAVWVCLSFVLTNLGLQFSGTTSLMLEVCVLSLAMVAGGREQPVRSPAVALLAVIGAFNFDASPFVGGAFFPVTIRCGVTLLACAVHDSLTLVATQRGKFKPTSKLLNVCYAVTQVYWVFCVHDWALVFIIGLAALRFYTVLPKSVIDEPTLARSSSAVAIDTEPLPTDDYDNWSHTLSREMHNSRQDLYPSRLLSRTPSRGGYAPLFVDEDTSEPLIDEEADSFGIGDDTKDPVLSEWRHQRYFRPQILSVLDEYVARVSSGKGGKKLIHELRTELVMVDRTIEEEFVQGTFLFYDGQLDQQLEMLELNRQEYERAVKGLPSLYDEEEASALGTWDQKLNVLQIYVPAWHKGLMRELIEEAKLIYEKGQSQKIITKKHCLNQRGRGQMEWGLPEESEPVSINNIILQGHSCPICVRHTAHRSASIAAAATQNQDWAKIIDDARKFLDLKESYLRRGISYQRSYLLHGRAGCGKSSFVKALASEFKMPIFELDFNEEDFADAGMMELMKELDSEPSTVIVLLKHLDKAYTRDPKWAIQHTTILNCVQGFLASDDRLLFITTCNRKELAKARDNEYEGADPALLRKGRISMEAEFKGANRESARQLFMHIFCGGPNISGLTRDQFEDIGDRFSQKIADSNIEFSFQPMVDFCCTRLSKPEKCVEEFTELEQLCAAPAAEKPKTSNMTHMRGRRSRRGRGGHFFDNY